ncbi:MAG: hypothetical protein M3R13_06180 [Armatimonadota bacterium]|nr:hypothetical protein [Armatimonadota bacterium]
MAERISQQIDELVWKVAEAGDSALEADLVQRYPHLRAELATRKAMVDVFRSARPVSPIATRFVPTRAAVRPRYWLVPLAAGLLMGLAFASYQVVKFGQSAPKKSVSKVIVPPQSPTPVPPDGRAIQAGPPPNSNLAPGTAERPEEVRSTDGLVVIATNGATLFGAIESIREKGLKIEIMPGLQDAPITLEPNQDDGTLALEPQAMLQAVRAAAGFELVDGGPDGYMALPSDKTNVVDGSPNRIRYKDVGGN